MHAIRATNAAILLLLAPALAAPALAQTAPPRCAESDGGGACVWGRAEGVEAGAIQVRGLRIQLMGIAAPSSRDLCGGKAAKDDFACAAPARKRMAELVAKGVACEVHGVAGDTLYGRCKGGDGDLARQLVAAGLVRAAKDGPYDGDQAAALAARKGLWAADVILPKEWETLRRRAEKD